MKSCLLVVCLFLSACASAPPNLSSTGVAAFNNTRVIKGLDLLRDTAVAANAERPPLISTATTRKIVQYHESALKTIHAVPTGWKLAVLTGLDEAVKNLPAPEQKLLGPYLVLTKEVILEVTK